MIFTKKTATKKMTTQLPKPEIVISSKVWWIPC